MESAVETVGEVLEAFVTVGRRATTDPAYWQEILDTASKRKLESAEARAAFRDAFRDVRYLFAGKTGCILQGYSFISRSADIDLYVDPAQDNRERLITALEKLGFDLTREQLITLRHEPKSVKRLSGRFEINLIFCLDGIDSFKGAWSRRVLVEGQPIASELDLTAYKKAAGRINGLTTATSRRP